MKKVMLISRNYNFLNEFINKFSTIYDTKYSYKPHEVKNTLQEHFFACIVFDISKIENEVPIIIRRMRKYIKIPIIIVSDKEHYPNIAKAIEIGADDYVIEPIDYDDLKNRIEMRTIKYSNTLEHNGLVIDRTRRQVSFLGNMISLTSNEFEILSILAGNPGFPYTKKDLYKAIWRMPDIDNTHTVQAHMFTLRKKLFEASNKEYIKTYWKKGYIFQNIEEKDDDELF